jgi:hypothetical protein
MGRRTSGGSTEWWPSLWCGPLLSARAIIAHYEKILVIAEDWQWSPMWLPITHSSWNQAAIELVTTGAGVVLDASWPDPPRVIAPSLSAALDATGDLAESGLLADATAPSIGPAWASWEERLRQVSSVRYEEVGWKNSPFEPGQDIDPERWPPGRRR